MSNEDVVYVDMEVNLETFKNGLNESLLLAKDNGKKLSPELLYKMQVNIVDMQLKLEEAKKRLKQAKKEGDKDAEIKLSLEINQLKRNLTEAKREINNYQNTGDKNLSRLQAKFDSVNNNINGNSKAIQGLIEKLGGVDSIGGKAVLGLGNKISGLKTKLLGIGAVIAVIVQLFRKSIGLFNDVDEARSILIKATGAYGDSLKGLETTVNSIFSKVPEKINVVADVVGELNTRLGITGELLENTGKQFLDFARITNSDPKQSVIDVTRLMGDWNIQAENTGAVLDILTKAGQESGIGINKLTNTTVNYGVQLRSLGFSLGESIALFSKFEKEGVSTEKMVGGLSQALGKIAKEGINDPIKGFEELIDRIQNAKTEGDALRQAIDLLGTRAGPDFALAVREGRFELDDYVELLKGANGAMQDTADRSLKAKDNLSIFGNRIKSFFIPIVVGFGNSVGWLGNKFIDSISTGYQFTKILFNNTIQFFSNFQKNIGIVFDNIPGYIAKGLNKATGMITNWVNKNIKALNGLGQFVGIKIPEVNLKTNYGGEIKSLIGDYQSLDDFRNKDKQGSNNDIASLFNTTANGLDDVSDEIDNINDKTLSGAKKLAEEKSKILDLEKEREERYEKYQESLLDKKKRRLETGKNLYDRFSSSLNDYIKGFSKNIDELDKKIKGTNDSISKLKDSIDSLEEGKTNNLSDRFIKIDDEVIKLQDEIKKLEQSGVSLSKAQGFGLNTLKNVGTGYLGSNTVEELIDILSKNDELNSLLNEQKLIKENISTDDLNKAVEFSQLSETEKILENYKIEKDLLKSKLEAEELYLEELEELREIEINNYDNFTSIKESLDERYKDFTMKLEADITKNNYDELKKREENLNASVDRQISKIRELIRIAENGGINISGTDLSPSAVSQSNNSGNSGGTTIVNNVFNQNISNSVDMNRVNESIVNTINKNSQGMSGRTL